MSLNFDANKTCLDQLSCQFIACKNGTVQIFFIKLTPKLYDHGVMIYEYRNITIDMNLEEEEIKNISQPTHGFSNPNEGQH